ncbi:hypothetical protein K0M31_020023 [Melipona bicolor]|uniref:Uncharacterized protein n=1 Tax=Melipona bicolor TaxID=60889 RepID=A0AA40G0U0_9HYME|nr:hypothetical protein K0M31_020023 [Melipona bicolor]
MVNRTLLRLEGNGDSLERSVRFAGNSRELINQVSSVDRYNRAKVRKYKVNDHGVTRVTGLIFSERSTKLIGGCVVIGFAFGGA